MGGMAPQPSPRTVDKMVEEQVRRWRLAQRRRHQEQAPPRPPPVITVSREFGSQGAAIGEAAANKLGLSFWDQQLVHAIADRSGAPERLVESLDEHSRGQLDDLITGALSGFRSTEYSYVRQLFRVIHTIQEHGGAVIIGRGAQYIIDPQDCLRVRVICPLAERVAGFAEREGLSREQAEAKVREVERDRRAFIRQSFDRDVTDENAYDLILNRAGFSIEPAADVVVAAYRAKHGARAEATRASAGAGPAETP